MAEEPKSAGEAMLRLFRAHGWPTTRPTLVFAEAIDKAWADHLRRASEMYVRAHMRRRP